MDGITLDNSCYLPGNSLSETSGSCLLMMMCKLSHIHERGDLRCAVV